ncbi:hypothetical protein DPEC_G00379270, partial [Dallia pectoralis]
MLTYRSASLREPQSAATSETEITVQDAQDLVGVASVLYMVTPDDEWARRGHLYCEGSHVFSENFGFRRVHLYPDGITVISRLQNDGSRTVDSNEPSPDIQVTHNEIPEPDTVSAAGVEGSPSGSYASRVQCMDTTAEEVQDAVMWISADVDGMPSESYASGVQYMDTTAEDLQIDDTTMVSIFDSTVDWTEPETLLQSLPWLDRVFDSPPEGFSEFREASLCLHLRMFYRSLTNDDRIHLYEL